MEEQQYSYQHQDFEEIEQESEQSQQQSDCGSDHESDPSQRNSEEEQQGSDRSRRESDGSQHGSDPEGGRSGEGEGEAGQPGGGAEPEGQFYELLYEIEYLIKMVEQNDQKFVIVKWKNFSLGETTKEPLNYIKGLQLVKDDLRKLEEDFEQKKYSPEQIVNIKSKTRQFLNDYRNALFPSEAVDHSRNRSASREKREVSIEQLTRCKHAAFQSTRKKLQMELNDLTPEDYFYFRNIYHDCQYQVKEQVRSHASRPTDMAPEEIVAVSRCEDGFRYIVEMQNGLLYTFSLQEMKASFPVTLAKFLRDFLDIMEEFMPLEIDYEEKLINHRLYRLREVNRAKQVISIKESFEFSKEPMFFGFDEEGALQNRRKFIENNRSNEQRNCAEPRGSSADIEEKSEMISEGGEKSEKQAVQSGKHEFDGFYRDMRGIMSELGIKPSKSEYKKKSTKQVIVNFNKLECQYHQYTNEVEFEPKSISLSSNNSSEISVSEEEEGEGERLRKKEQKELKIGRKGSLRRSIHSRNQNSNSPHSRDSNAMDEEVDIHTPSRSSSRLKDKLRVHYNSDDLEEGLSDSSHSSKKPTKKQKRE